MKIGEVASKTGVSRDTIRLYEKKGLLGTVTRPHEYNNYKEYGEENVFRINMIKEMKKIGLTLNECKGVIDALVQDEMGVEDRRAFILKKISEVESKIAALKKVRGFLQERIDNDCAFTSTSMIAKIKGEG